jgi:hypothetical protein
MIYQNTYINSISNLDYLEERSKDYSPIVHCDLDLS